MGVFGAGKWHAAQFVSFVQDRHRPPTCDVPAAHYVHVPTLLESNWQKMQFVSFVQREQ